MKTRYGKIRIVKDGLDGNEGLALGLLLGAAIGVCATLAFTSKSGKGLRKKLREEAGRKADELGAKWEQAKDRAGELAEDAKETAQSVGDDAKSAVNEYTDKAKDAASDAKESVKDEFQKRY